MKILIIHNHYLEKGGEGRVVDSEIELLRNHGHQVVVYTRSNTEFKQLPVRDKVRFFLHDIVWSEKTYNEIRNLVDNEKPDIAHIHNIFFMITPSVYYALSDRGISIVQTLHNYRFFCLKGIFYRKGKICEECQGGYVFPSVLHKCFRNSHILSYFFSKVLRTHFKKSTFKRMIDCYIALSNFSKNKLIRSGLPENKIYIKPNFVDIEIDEEEEAQDYSLFVGRLVDYKGVRTLIKAYKQLHDCKLKIIGDGPLNAYVKKITQKNHNIELLGQLTYKETINYIKKAKFVVFPSECYENMSRVIIESFACAIPILASDRAGTIRELIQDKLTGIFFKAQNSNDLIAKIEYLMKNRELVNQMGKNARQVYQDNYRPERNYHILMDIYERTLNKTYVDEKHSYI